jgi:hypothetical protein
MSKIGHSERLEDFVAHVLGVRPPVEAPNDLAEQREGEVRVLRRAVGRNHDRGLRQGGQDGLGRREVGPGVAGPSASAADSVTSPERWVRSRRSVTSARRTTLLADGHELRHVPLQGVIQRHEPAVPKLKDGRGQ